MIDFIKKTLVRLRLVPEYMSTWIDFHQSGVETRQPLTFHERLFFFKLKPCLLEQDMVFYDVGAARGTVTAMVAKLKSVKHVYAFEPIPQVFEELKRNVDSFTNVQCFPVALSDTNSQSTFYQSEATDSSSLLPMAELHRAEYPSTAHTVPTTVDTMRLDDLVAQENLLPPDVVKIDVQGFELHVMEGGLQTIQQTTFCILEMSFAPLYEGAPIFGTVYDQMRNWGFELVGIAGTSAGQSGHVLQVDGIFQSKDVR